MILDSPIFWYAILALLVGMNIWTVVHILHARGIKGIAYAIKSIANSLINIGLVAWILVIFVGGILLTPSVINWAKYQKDTLSWAFMGNMVGFFPSVWVLTVMVFREKLPRYLKWIVKEVKSEIR